MIRIGFLRTTRRLLDSVKEAQGMGFEVMAAPYVTVLKGDDREFIKITDALSSDRPVRFMTSTAVEICSDHFKESFPAMFRGRRVSAPENVSLCLAKSGIDSVPEPAGGELRIGADPEEASVYKEVPAGMGSPILHLMIAIKRGEIDWIALTSPGTADYLYEFLEKKYGKENSRLYMDEHVKIAVMNRETEERLASYGRKPDLVSPEPYFSSLLKSVSETERAGIIPCTQLSIFLCACFPRG